MSSAAFSNYHAEQFRGLATDRLDRLLLESKQNISAPNTLKIDLHCHDRNSDVPDELWGRLLRLPETWLKTSELVHTLKERQMDVITITNHNNAKSCWNLLEKGEDVLVGAEFTCIFPEYDLYVHVLTYGFTPEQENHLNILRKDVYRFMAYCNEHHLPTVLPHPLYFYTKKGQPPLAFFEKCAVLFERFEGINGQRDTWQNLLCWEWVRSLTEEKITAYAEKHKLNPYDYSRRPFEKQLTGGSDDHFGLFAGQTGTFLNVPNLERKKQILCASDLALYALRQGTSSPFGQAGGEERLMTAFLDYFCQMALNIEDPGLLRLFLHQGELSDKLWCLAIGNGLMELQRHKYTTRFLKAFHGALRGEKPSLLMSLAVHKDYSPLLDHLHTIARTAKKDPENLAPTLKNIYPILFKQLTHLSVDRVQQKLSKHVGASLKKGEGAKLLEDVLTQSEVPLYFRNWKFKSKKKDKNDTSFDLGELLDNLRFPFLMATLTASASLASTQVLYNSRNTLNQFADQLGSWQHPKRILWLTDTIKDKNGVSSALQSVLAEVRMRNLPIDFLCLDPQAEGEGHLKVLRPVTEFKIPGFDSQTFRMPDLMEVQKLMIEGGYDRILCSTEMLMGPVALFLKHACGVPVYFFMHTDWMEFLRRNTQMDKHNLDRSRRILRWFYKQFDGIFVLNREHKEWLASESMGIDEKKLHLTAHWVEENFTPQAVVRNQRIPDLEDDEKVLLYVGRLSEEKGVFDVIHIAKQVAEKNIKVRLVFAGVGPAEAELKKWMPENLKVTFLGWIVATELPSLYSMADMMIFPSRFDTFGCAVLEALACGCPVAAYNTKGPADIIEDNLSGLLTHTPETLAESIAMALSDKAMMVKLKRGALARARLYQPHRILKGMMKDMKMGAI